MSSDIHSDKKIMIVDDDPDILVSLRALFEPEGYEVITVENGRKCLNELENGFRGIILMDIMMPVMDGVDTIKNMIVEGFLEGNTIIVLTAKRIQGTEFNEIYPYIYDYIPKPFDINTLMQLVKRIAEGKAPKK